MMKMLAEIKQIRQAQKLYLYQEYGTSIIWGSLPVGKEDDKWLINYIFTRL